MCQGAIITPALLLLGTHTEKQVLTVYDLPEASERLKWLPEDQMKLAGTAHQDHEVKVATDQR